MPVLRNWRKLTSSDRIVTEDMEGTRVHIRYNEESQEQTPGCAHAVRFAIATPGCGSHLLLIRIYGN